jgi:hypothetical protein
MATEKEDTDPSSPGALRTPSGRHPRTDPGLGPHSDSPVSPRRPLGVIVPAPSGRPSAGPNAITPPEMRAIPPAALSSKDSVELLLEGMTGPRPDRRKTRPQSDGDAAAAYHAEHGVRRARTSSEPGPKVVVERPMTSPVPRERSPSAGVVRPAGPSREALSTFVPGRVLKRRVAIALLAGGLIVFLLFVVLRAGPERHDVAPAVAGGAVEIAPTIVTAPAAPRAPPPEVARDPVTPVTPIALVVASSETRGTAPTDRTEPAGASARATGAARSTEKGRRDKTLSAPSPRGNSDLGEFKTTF